VEIALHLQKNAQGSGYLSLQGTVSEAMHCNAIESSVWFIGGAPSMASHSCAITCCSQQRLSRRWSVKQAKARAPCCAQLTELIPVDRDSGTHNKNKK
jgi:hypothetical protein